MLITLENIIQAVHSSKSESADKMMKSGSFAIFLFLSSGLHLSMANSVEDRCRVKVELFYDTFCPDVIDFIQGKLYPVWDARWLLSSGNSRMYRNPYVLPVFCQLLL